MNNNILECNIDWVTELKVITFLTIRANTFSRTLFTDQAHGWHGHMPRVWLLKISVRITRNGTMLHGFAVSKRKLSMPTFFQSSVRRNNGHNWMNKEDDHLLARFKQLKWAFVHFPIRIRQLSESIDSNIPTMS